MHLTYLCIPEKCRKWRRQVERFLAKCQQTELGKNRVGLTWKPVVFLGLSSLLTSDSSLPTTLAADFFFGVRFFLLTAVLRLLPPRVGRAILSSSACSLAARVASSSTLAFLFFLGGASSMTSERSSLEAARLTGELAAVVESGADPSDDL